MSFQKEFEKTVIGLSRGEGSRGDILDPPGLEIRVKAAQSVIDEMKMKFVLAVKCVCAFE